MTEKTQALADATQDTLHGGTANQCLLDHCSWHTETHGRRWCFIYVGPRSWKVIIQKPQSLSCFIIFSRSCSEQCLFFSDISGLRRVSLCLGWHCWLPFYTCLGRFVVLIFSKRQEWKRTAHQKKKKPATARQIWKTCVYDGQCKQKRTGHQKCYP